MAMLISKFHRLIQSKLVWAAILVIIVFSFVIWGTQMPTQADRNEASSPGTLNGEPVDARIFRQMYFNTYLTVIMSVGRQVNITPEIDQQLRKATWQRMVALQQAKEMGLTASDDEVASAIQQHEAFLTGGQFNKAVYKAFVQQFLAGLGFTERMFEEHVREEIVMQKARLVLERSTLVTPLELKRAFSSVSDKFKVDYVVLTPELVETEVKTSRDAARAFFDQDPAAFTLPERVKVQYVRFSDDAFRPEVTVTDEEIRAYYDENLADFEVEDTNTLAEAATNLLATVGKVTRPFEEVRQDITNKLIQQAARGKAGDQAMNFVVALTPDRDGRAASFAAVAAQFGATVNQTGPFAADDTVEGVDAGPAFTRAAFELTEGDESYFSNPVEGEEGVYVLALLGREPARIPTFEEVEEKVMPMARAKALEEALSRKSAEVRETVDNAMKAGQGFAEAVAAFGLEAVTNLEFTSSSKLESTPHAETLVRGVLMSNRGELTKLLPARDAVLLAYVADRIAGDPATYESIKGQLVGSIRRQNGRVNFDAWQEDLLAQANFKERATIPDETEIPEEEPAGSAL